MSASPGRPDVLPVREAYRLWAPAYDSENVVTELERHAVRRLTPPLAGTRLLDAGCGTGRRLPKAGGTGPRRVVGMDLVHAMLEAGRKRGVTHGLAVADVRALPCRDRSFDVIWCRLVVGHVTDLDAAYRELARIAAPGACVVVTDFHPAAAAAGHVRSFRAADGTLCAVEHHVHDVATHLQTAQQAGLTLAGRIEPAVGPAARDFYASADRMDLYERQLGLPLVLALALRA